jgi:hemerythrin-like domain-containing protein
MSGAIGTSPTTALREEHRVILRALALLEVAIERPAGTRDVPDEWWARLIRWLRAFADRNHHAKEERWLFPALAKAGMPAEGGPVAVMLAEHAEGRALVALMAEDPGRRRVAARGYVDLLRSHIDKENDVLFPLAEALLGEDERRAVARGFATVEAAGNEEASLGPAEAELERLAVMLE